MRVVPVWLAAACLVGSPIVVGQMMGLAAEPPKGVLWTMEEDGDALQTDLGFIVPAKWKDFVRQGFSSTRPDGGSVKAYYLTPEPSLKLTLWLQLRPDIRGLPLDADAVWSLMQFGIGAEYGLAGKDKVTKLSEGSFSLGNRTPAGRYIWQRYDLPNGPEVQGAWWQNIGVWSVIITFSGPESRRADLEAAANTLIAEMPFPSAPLVTELLVNGQEIFERMPNCKGKTPEGAGKEIVPTFQQGMLYSLLVPSMQMGQHNELLISPVTHAKDYCAIESFTASNKLPVIAIQYRGAPGDTWEARYGLVINNGRGGYYQLERLAPKIAQEKVADAQLDQVYLHYTNNKRTELVTVFDDWPSYEGLKKAFEAFLKGKPGAIIATIKTAEKLNIQTNTARIQPAPETATPNNPAGR